MYDEMIQPNIRIASSKDVFKAAKAAGAQVARFFEQRGLSTKVECDVTTLMSYNAYAQMQYTLQIADRILKEEDRATEMSIGSYLDGDKTGLCFHVHVTPFHYNGKFAPFRLKTSAAFQKDMIDSMLSSYYEKNGPFSFIPFRQQGRDGFEIFFGNYIGGVVDPTHAHILDKELPNNADQLSRIRYIEHMATSSEFNNSVIQCPLPILIYMVYKANCYDNSGFALDYNPDKHESMVLRQNKVR